MRLDTMEEQEDLMLGGDSPQTGSKRRANKHLIERRRRARINSSLTQLKGLVLEGMRKDPARYNRLEKADILEMTVTHLRALKADHNADTSEPAVLSKYRAGFHECALEVARFLNGLPTIDDSVKANILTHMNECVQRVGQTLADANTSSPDASRSSPATPSPERREEGRRMISDLEPLDLSRRSTSGSATRREAASPPSGTPGRDLPGGRGRPPPPPCISPEGTGLFPPQGGNTAMDLSDHTTMVESVDSGLDDEVSSTEGLAADVRPDDDGGLYAVEPGEEEAHMGDDSMWRPW